MTSPSLICTACNRPHTKANSKRLRKEIERDLREWPIGRYPLDYLTKIQAKSLERRGITNVGGIIDLGADALPELVGFGPASVREIRSRITMALESLGERAHVKSSGA